MFQFGGGGPTGAEAVEKESFGGGKRVPKAFAQVGGKHQKKKKPMRFGPPAKSSGLDFESIMGKR